MSLTQKVSWFTLSNFLSTGIGLIVSIIVARILTKHNYGTYQQVFLLDLIVSNLLISGIGGSAIYFFSKLDDKQRLQHITNIICLLGFCGVLISVITYSGAGIIANMIKNPGVKELLQLYSLKTITTFLVCIFGPLMITANRVKEVVAAGIIFSFVNSVCYIVVLWYAPTLMLLIMVSVALGWIQLGYMTWRCWETLRQLPIRFDKVLFKKEKSYIGSMLFQTGAGKLGYEADKLTVVYFMSSASYAIYIVGAREIPLLRNFTGAVNSLLIPEINRLWEQGRKSEILALWRRAISKTALIYIPIFVFLMIYAKELLTLLYSDKYFESVILFQIYLVLIPLRSATYGLIFQAIGQMKYVTRATFIFLVFNVIANVILIQVMGLSGPALATVIGSYIMAAYYIFYLRSFFDVTLLDLLPIVQLGRVFLMTLPAIAISIATSNIWFVNFSQLVRFLVAGVAFSAIYILTAVIFDNNAREYSGKFLSKVKLNYARN